MAAGARHVASGSRAEAAWWLLPIAFPLLPLEEKGWLNDMAQRENPIERVLPVEKA